MPDPTILYCTDESIRIRCAGDFDELVPSDQILALGFDGVLLASTPWLLTSASVNFMAVGVVPGNVVVLTFDTGNGVHFGVDSVTSSGLVLKRIGQSATGLGMPPVTANATGIQFSVPTFGPQIEDATYDLNRRYNIDDNFPNRQASYLYDARELRQATVLTVLRRQYTTENRAKDGDFANKLGSIDRELNEVLARLQVQWGQFGQGQEPSNRFSMNIRR